MDWSDVNDICLLFCSLPETLFWKHARVMILTKYVHFFLMEIQSPDQRMYEHNL